MNHDLANVSIFIGFGISLSADPSITDGVVCANQDVHFTCQMLGIQHVEQYLWSFGQTTLKSGQQKETYNISSSLISINVTCVIYAHVNNRSISGSISVLLSISKAASNNFLKNHVATYMPS